MYINKIIKELQKEENIKWSMVIIRAPTKQKNLVIPNFSLNFP